MSMTTAYEGEKITTAYENRRILLIDDNESIHEDFRRILCPAARDGGLAATEAELFGEVAPPASQAAYEVKSALQGRDGLALVQKAVANGLPFAVAFVDVRMPPGWDGIQTIERMWLVDPRLQVVLCTAYSDHSWQDIVQRLGGSDRFLILKKPFDAVEAQQLALTLTTKWNLARAAEGQQAALEAAVAMRSRQLIQAREVAEQASRAKSRFLVHVSREICRPVGDLVGQLDCLATAELTAAQRQQAQAARQSAHALLCMATNMVNFTAIEAGSKRLERGAFDLHAVIEKTVDAFAGAASAKGLALSRRIEDTVPRHVVGDPGCVAQILSNLVANAIQFTEQGSVTVRVGLESRLEDACTVRFCVSDTGIGVPLDKLDCLFQAFSQVPASKGGGAGLGLALCKGLAELHGGTVGVSSSPGEGSDFWFSVVMGLSV